MSNRHRLLPLLPCLVATATVTLGVALAPSAHADDTGAPRDDTLAAYLAPELNPGVTDPIAECLFAHGGHGLAGDGGEYIYTTTSILERCSAVAT